MSYQPALSQSEMSFELYQEIADELSSPIDPRLEPQVRFELYSSKLVFLRNLFEQCFKIVNQVSKVNFSDTGFTAADLNLIHEAVDMTHLHLRETILESLKLTFKKLDETKKNEQASI